MTKKYKNKRRKTLKRRYKNDYYDYNKEKLKKKKKVILQVNQNQ